MIFGRYKISGHSMQPTYNPGDQVLTWKFSKIHKGDVVVFKNGSKYLVKRVTKISNDLFFVAGDNKNDSLRIDSVHKKDILGKVLFTL